MGKLLSLFILVLCFTSCTQSVDLGTNATTGTTTTGGTSDPSKPTYTPPSSTGDSTNGGTTSTGGTTTKKVDSLVVTATSITPCVATNEQVSFTITGVNIPANATYEWYFSDGVSIASGPATVSNTFKSPGTYSVLAKVDSGGKILATTTKSIVIAGNSGSPVANFTTQLLNPSTTGNNFAFNSTSTVPKGSIKTYAWDFGDANADNSNNSYVTHAYNQLTNAQNYTVTLKVTNDIGCTGSKSATVSVLGGTPVVTAISGSFTDSSTSPCAPSAEKFTYTSNVVNLPVGAVYNWDFGDGTTATGNPVTKIYSTANTYPINMNITNAGGASIYAIQRNIKAAGQNVTPTASMSVTPTGSTGNSFTFQNTSTVPNGTITNNLWDFSDGSTTTLSTIGKTYAQDVVPRTYTVKLVSTSSAGCKSTAFRTITIPAQ